MLFPDAGSCADISFPTEYNFKPYVDEEVPYNTLLTTPQTSMIHENVDQLPSCLPN